MQDFEKAINTIKDSKNYLITLFNSTNKDTLSEKDKIYLFNNVLPIVGKKDPFIKEEFFKIIEKHVKDFHYSDIWSKYEVVTIDSIIDIAKDFITDNVTYLQVSKELIQLALKTNIYSFEIDW